MYLGLVWKNLSCTEQLNICFEDYNIIIRSTFLKLALASIGIQSKNQLNTHNADKFPLLNGVCTQTKKGVRTRVMKAGVSDYAKGSGHFGRNSNGMSVSVFLTGTFGITYGDTEIFRSMFDKLVLCSNQGILKKNEKE